MEYYDLTKEQRQILILKMKKEIKDDLKYDLGFVLKYASNKDFYIRKNTFLILGSIYFKEEEFKPRIIKVARKLLQHEDENIRQTAVYIFSEIGKDAKNSFKYLELALKDDHHMLKML